MEGRITMSENNDSDTSLRWKKVLKISAVFIISLILVWFLLTRITFEDLKVVFSEIQPIYIILGFCVYIFVYLFRCLRFYFLLEKKVKFKNLFLIVCVHNMINKILPARTGELSYIYLLKKHKISLEERIATLAFARIIDFIIIASFFLISIIFLRNLPGIIGGVIWIITVLLIVLIFLLFMLLYFGDSFKDWINKLAVKLKIYRFNIIKRLLKIIEDTILSFKTFKSKNVIIKTILLSIAIWTSFFIVYHLYTIAFQIELEFVEIIVIVSFMALLPLLPFYAAGGFGTTEVTITIFFVAFGVNEALAIVASFGIHIIGLIYVIILGVLGSLLLNLNDRMNKLTKQTSKL